MNTTIAPTVTDNASSTLTRPANGSWVDATHYVIDYTVADANVTLADVTFNVSGAKDLAGNTQVAASGVSSGTNVDTLNPTVTIDIVATSLSDTTNSSLVNFTFSEAPVGFDITDISPTHGSI